MSVHWGGRGPGHTCRLPQSGSAGGGGNTYGYVGTGASAANNAGSPVVLALGYPAGIAVNDILIASIVTMTGTTTPSSVTPPAGWTFLTSTNLDTATAYTHHIYWKRATGSESGTAGFSCTNSGSTTFLGTMSSWGGCVTTGSPFVDLKTTTGRSTTANSGSVTTSAANQFVANYVAQEANVAQTPPATFTEAYDIGYASGYTAGIGMNYKSVASAGAVGAQTTTLASSKRWSVISFGLLKA